MERRKVEYLLPAFLVFLFAVPLACGAQGVCFVTKQQLKKELGNPSIVILDVRTPRDWKI